MNVESSDNLVAFANAWTVLCFQPYYLLDGTMGSSALAEFSVRDQDMPLAFVYLTVSAIAFHLLNFLLTVHIVNRKL